MARALDEVLAAVLPMEVRLDAAERDRPPAGLGAIDDLGFQYLGLPTAAGGFDLDQRSLALMGWVAGRRLLPVPLRNEALLAAPILHALSASVGDGLLGDMLDGGKVVGSGLHPSRSRGGVEGEAEVWARSMPDVVVLATDDGRAAVWEPTTGLRFSAAIDRGQGRMLVDAPDAWLGSGSVATIVRRWHLFLLAELLGVCDHVTRVTVAYAKTRHQFGRAIAGFQAVSHMIADMYASTELARSAVATLADADDGPEADAMVSSYAITVPAIARQVCETAIQVHGGMGFTWEYGLHLYYRRALQAQATLGGRLASERALGLRLLGERS